MRTWQRSSEASRRWLQRQLASILSQGTVRFEPWDRRRVRILTSGHGERLARLQHNGRPHDRQRNKKAHNGQGKASHIVGMLHSLGTETTTPDEGGGEDAEANATTGARGDDDDDLAGKSENEVCARVLRFAEQGNASALRWSPRSLTLTLHYSTLPL